MNSRHDSTKTAFDVVVIGGGPAGMGAALAARRSGASVAIIERDRLLGGILRQCIHPGFGLSRYKGELTGPEYAQHLIDEVASTDIRVLTECMVLSIEERSPSGRPLIRAASPEGVVEVECGSIVLAMGCRERTRSEIKIPGSRPAGVYTAGLAQRYLNMENLVPGRRFVILGSGDIGLIMARRLTLEGLEVEGVYEIMPYANGLNRNVKNCLEDFGIPLHLSTTVTRVMGEGRVEAVEVSRVDEALSPIPGTERVVPCDTLLLSVGLIPENELARAAGVEIDPRTRGASVDQDLMTTVPAIFSCGNVLHVHDLADSATMEAEAAGAHAAKYAMGLAGTAHDDRRPHAMRLQPDGLAGYVLPQRITSTREPVAVKFRVKRPVANARLVISSAGETIFLGKPRAYKPSIMESVRITPSTLSRANGDIRVSVEPVTED